VGATDVHVNDDDHCISLSSLVCMLTCIMYMQGAFCTLESNINLSLFVEILMTLEQGCTTHGPNPTPERVISGPWSRLKNTTSLE